MDAKTVGGAPVTPTLVAELFWSLDSEQQADFFAELDNIAGYKLCQQMAYIVSAIHRRSEQGDHTAQDGFQTMLVHSERFVTDGIESRYWGAKYELRRMAELAKEQQP